MSKNYNSNSLLDYAEQIPSQQVENKILSKEQKKESSTFLKIGTVAKMLDVNTSVLRFWEDQFEELEPTRSEKGQRLYSHQDVALIKKIKKLLHNESLTIEGAKKSLAKGQLPKGRQDVRPKIGNIPTLSLHKTDEPKKEERVAEENQAAKILKKALESHKNRAAKEKDHEIATLRAIEQELLALKDLLTK